MPGYDFSKKVVVSTKKKKYQEVLLKCFQEYKKALIINVDFVGSKILQNLRKDLRGRAQIVMGKNTVIRKILRVEEKVQPKLGCLIPYIQGNIGFVFTNEELIPLRELIVSCSQVPASAKAGVLAPIDVYLEPGSTGLDPGQTSFFQAMNIQTKINRGAIEIVGRSKLITKGEKVSMSATVLLSKLKKKPFTYSINVLRIFEQSGADASCYPSAVLDLSEADIETKFLKGLAHAASLSLGLDYPSAGSIPQLLSHAVRKCIAFSIETKYDLPVAEPYKKFLENPDAFASAAPAADAGDAKEDVKKQEEEEEESDGADGMDLFD